jgi:hypothetical protein
MTIDTTASTRPNQECQDCSPYTPGPPADLLQSPCDYADLCNELFSPVCVSTTHESQSRYVCE